MTFEYFLDTLGIPNVTSLSRFLAHFFCSDPPFYICYKIEKLKTLRFFFFFFKNQTLDLNNGKLRLHRANIEKEVKLNCYCVDGLLLPISVDRCSNSNLVTIPLETLYCDRTEACCLIKLRKKGLIHPCYKKRRFD